MSLIGIGIRLVLIAAVAGAILYAKHRYDDDKRDIGRHEVQAAWDKDKAARMEQLARINQERVDAVAKADAAIREADDERSKRFAAVSRSVPIGPVAAGPAGRLLDDAIRAANNEAARPASETNADAAAVAPSAADADFGPWLHWGATVSDMYASCREQVGGWIAFYNDVRNAQ